MTKEEDDRHQKKTEKNLNFSPLEKKFEAEETSSALVNYANSTAWIQNLDPLENKATKVVVDSDQVQQQVSSLSSLEEAFDDKEGYSAPMCRHSSSLKKKSALKEPPSAPILIANEISAASIVDPTRSLNRTTKGMVYLNPDQSEEQKSSLSLLEEKSTVKKTSSFPGGGHVDIEASLFIFSSNT